ncbi:DgyrCDS13545 [Dimorphilus gyrociliatus]|uniref:Anion exchange protein n=1 Tax=Dimorphilus gyrociliatus TaxID=2664684 RepID=A0A7I8WAZ9_9ANNE|nr:DgyrCDS13545 [Dimorphilus gyrociliatus]
MVMSLDVKGDAPTFFIEDANENCIGEYPRLLCELLEFDYEKDVWKEKSRLIKFEETVEEGGERWSKPHVAALSLEAVHQSKEVLENAILLQDIQAENYKDFTEKLFAKLESDTDLKEEQLEELGKLLYKKHRHLKGRYKKLGDGGSGTNTPSDNRSPAPIRSSRTDPVLKPSQLGVTGISQKPSMSDLLEHLDSRKDDEIFTPNKKFAKHLPKNCEAADVLVGHADFLDEPICLWIRLKEPKILKETLTEVLVPTRFFILFLGPKLMYDYKEIGRVMATMLADSYFRPCAFSAQTKDDLLEGFQESIEAGTALPPGQWDRSLRIEPPSNLPSHPIRKRPSKNSIAKDKESIQYEDTEDHAEEHGDATLVRSGRLFGGLVQDIKRKAPHYLSDFKDALHPQCLASVIFIYIACLSPIITFGGLQGAATDNYLAAMEGILSGAICGVIYVLFCGQPLTVLGATGPMLVFETILFRLCKTFGWYFLSMRLWVGVWSGLFIIIICALDLSALVTYITRFTEEAFATLICIIFIQQAISKLLSIRKEYGVNTDPFNVEKSQCYCFPKPNSTLISHFNITTTSMPYTTASLENATMPTGPTLIPTLLATKQKCLDIGGNPVGDGCNYVPNVFFFSVLLFIVMFTVSITLKSFRNSPFFPSKVRQIVSDFNVVIGVIISVLIDWLVGLDTPKLKVPEQFKPTRWEDRGWIVPALGGNPWYTILIAIVPALLCTILIFLDQQITAVIVNRKENKLKKGGGYHLDIFILSIITILTSVMGLPWFVAATVRAMTHVNSLRVESEAAAPGEKPEFYGIRENRVTMLLVSILIGLSVQLTTVFKMIPMPVLYGVFMYMGVGALRGLQLVDRLLLLFMPQKHQPEYNFLKKVKTWRVHLFTLIQCICLGLLWVVKAIKVTSIAFPLMILLICVVRKLMERCFTQSELGALDNILPQDNSKKDKKKR